ncbi:MAG TPA: tetratricopeptide repeat-containing protein kinase family protein, partial [Myxococcaceae bacterium]|nr:tetratricopeptide repeat-containing protein kinase family protein [Myxococcaceae bacterium]
EVKRPATKEIVAKFLHAGRALAAAHAVQLIHRDFKLDNVLVAADGRVLVSDFGLARGAREAEGFGPVSTSQPLLDTAMTPKEDVFGAMLTQTGSILGTPAYMAPEQLLGQRTDARVDQFSFCVSLYEALYRERPFAGERLDALVHEVTAGKVRDPPKSSRVPSWLRLILLRGLKTNAGERYPSMEALLADLEKDPAIARRRWLYAAGVAAVIAIPLIGYRQIKHQQSLLCKGADKELAGIWNDEKRAGISRAFLATGKPYAQTAVASVGKAFDRYSQDWVTMFTQACEATRLRGTQSEELLDLRMECLSRRRAGFQALIEIFASADGKVVERSVDAAQVLAPLEGCADAAALKAPVRPPADPAVRAKVDELRRKLATANAMHASGKYREGLALATEIAQEAKGLQYRPLEAEALDQLGRLQQATGDRKTANETLKQAVLAAEAGRHDEIAAKSLTGLVASNRVLGRYDDARESGMHAEAALERLGAKEKPQIVLLTEMGNLFADQRKFDEAFAYYRRAQSIRDKISVEPSYGDLNYLGWATTSQGRPEEGLQYQRRALALAEPMLGSEHPRVADILGQMGRTFTLLGRYEEALGHQKRALAIQEKSLGPQHPQVALTLVGIGRALRGLGRQDEALDYFRRSLALYEAALGPDHWELANPLEDIGSILASRGEYEPAIANFERAAALVEKTFGPDMLVASLLTKIGRAAMGLGDSRKAISSLERALSIREKHPERATDLAETRFALARALKKSGRDRERAMTLAANAREAYVTAGDKYRKNVAEVDDWIGGKRRPNP